VITIKKILAMEGTLGVNTLIHCAFKNKKEIVT
jgi:hypothetical protein